MWLALRSSHWLGEGFDLQIRRNPKVHSGLTGTFQSVSLFAGRPTLPLGGRPEVDALFVCACYRAKLAADLSTNLNKVTVLV